jgi:hypothetical protein
MNMAQWPRHVKRVRALKYSGWTAAGGRQAEGYAKLANGAHTVWIGKRSVKVGATLSSAELMAPDRLDQLDRLGELLHSSCGPAAIALTTGIDVREVKRTARDSGWVTPKGMDNGDLIRTLWRLGFDALRYRDPPRTVGDLADHHPSGRFIVVVANHYMSVVDGRIDDRVAGYGRRNRVKEVWRIVRFNSPIRSADEGWQSRPAFFLV